LMSLMVLPGISVGVVLLHRQWIAPALEGTTQFAGQWQRDWPVTLESIFNFRSLAIPATSVGGVFYALVWISVMYMLIQPKRRRLLFVAARWALPAMLFWSLRAGNSARHLMVSYSIVMLLPAVMLTGKFVSRKSLTWALVLIIGVNYFANTSKNWGFHVGGRLIESRMAMQGIVNNLEIMGGELAHLPYQNKLLHSEESSCYLIWKVLKEAESFTVWYREYYSYYIESREGVSYTVFEIPPDLHDDWRMGGCLYWDYDITGKTTKARAIPIQGIKIENPVSWIRNFGGID